MVNHTVIYSIGALNISAGEYGGLFEFIGEKGIVKDLFVYDCNFKGLSLIHI